MPFEMFETGHRGTPEGLPGTAKVCLEPVGTEGRRAVFGDLVITLSCL